MLLKWDYLAPWIDHRKVAFILPDGTSVAGKVMAVEPDALRLKVTYSSNRRVQPKGRRVIPRRSLSVLRVTEYRKKGRLPGTLGAAAWAGGIAAVAGDKHVTEIRIEQGPTVDMLIWGPDRREGMAAN
jgi:hypothetical protein